MRTNSVCSSSSRPTRSRVVKCVTVVSTGRMTSRRAVPGGSPRLRRGNSRHARHRSHRIGGAHAFEANRRCSLAPQTNTQRHILQVIEISAVVVTGVGAVTYSRINSLANTAVIVF